MKIDIVRMYIPFEPLKHALYVNGKFACEIDSVMGTERILAAVGVQELVTYWHTLTDSRFAWNWEDDLYRMKIYQGLEHYYED